MPESPRSFEIEAPAKINLWLRVLAQEASGYHSLESLFCAISLHDTLRVERGSGEIQLEVEANAELGPIEENLAYRAARRFFLERRGLEDGVRIRLHKRIPAAAGLGGGSSDAAATLLALNSLFGDPFSADQLIQMGIELGSDVPFFLGGSPLALGWSRGERLLALPPLPPRPVLVAHPGVPMPTGAAFQRVAELRGGVYRPRTARLTLRDVGDWDAIARLAANDFQEPADETIGTLPDARRRMRLAGASIALLAGSGASIFGVFPDAEARDRAASDLQEAGFTTWAAETLDRLPDPRSPSSGTVDPDGSQT
jgi:4-diphosphocytidyl-2-C-methyl-D-erythritol kinase